MLALLLGAAILGAGIAGAYEFFARIRDFDLKSLDGIVIAAAGTAILLGLFLAGTRVLTSGLKVRPDVIPREDRKLLEPLIESSNEKAIEQYIRLSSLAGATGIATRLGLTGLPLLTVALTLIFSGLALVEPEREFMDLAKLTLGAFIGSFVQRSATSQAVAETGRVPYGP